MAEVVFTEPDLFRDWAFSFFTAPAVWPFAPKNLEFLTNCMVELLKKEPRAHALIVGLGPSEQMIKNTFAQAGLEKRLHLTGVLHYQQLVDSYFAMDVFAFA